MIKFKKINSYTYEVFSNKELIGSVVQEQTGREFDFAVRDKNLIDRSFSANELMAIAGKILSLGTP